MLICNVPGLGLALRIVWNEVRGSGAGPRTRAPVAGLYLEPWSGHSRKVWVAAFGLTALPWWVQRWPKVPNCAGPEVATRVMMTEGLAFPLKAVNGRMPAPFGTSTRTEPLRFCKAVNGASAR